MKIRNLLVVFLFLLAMVPATIFAQVDNWDGTAVQWTHGTGTQADPYLIESAENLAWISEMVNNGVTTYAGVYFRMTTDLNMRNIAWVPIGNSTTNLFCGNFDGNNHFIDNISVSGSYTYAGLFGIIGAGSCCANLGVKSTISSSSSSSQYRGGIVGYVKGDNTVVVNCYNTGNISAITTSTGRFSGGIIGYCYGASVRIENCHNTGSVDSTSYSGGIVGSCDGASVRIENCHNTGGVSAATTSTTSLHTYSGGIVGYCNVDSACIENCYNTGSVSSFSSGYSTSNSGGIMGGNVSGSTTMMIKCFNTGTVTSTSRKQSNSGNLFSNSGGLVGSTYGSRIFNSYNRGAVRAYAYYNTNTVGGTRQAGGLVGKVYSTSTTFRNSYNTGTLTGGVMGGIRGNTMGSVTNCYYLETCGGTVEGGTSKTAAAMKSTSFPVLLNADSIVFVMDLTPNVNAGYPIFGSSICEVTTDAATNVNFTSATLNGHYTPYQYWSGGDADVMGFEYKQTSDANYTTVYSNIGTTASYNLTQLLSGTTYTYRMFVQKDGVTYYGDIVNFNTLQCNVTATIVPASASICAGDTAELTVNVTSSHSEDFTYSWSTGDTIPSVRITVAGTYRVTVVDGNGCSKTTSRNVTVNPVPTGTISGNTSLCAGESSVLTASGANSYTWNTGASTPTLTVNESGTYTCTFRNSYGCTSTQSVEVTVFSSPVITGETAFCAGGSTTLTATGGSNYTWNNGATTPSITVSTPGTYSVTGTSTGGCSGSSSVTVAQRELPSVSIYGTPVICSGIGAELTATEGSSYLWSTGETTQSITANHTGNYSVLVTDANGCSNTTSVEVGALTSVAISGNTSICQGETATLSVEMEGEYLWSTGAQTSLISVSNAGVYSVTVSLSNGCSTSATANVSVIALPIPTITGNTAFCEGQSTMLYANGGTSYQWNSGTSGSTLMVNAEGNYTVTATNAQGCTATASTYVTVYPLPNITISGNTATCQGNQVILTANGAQSYQWNTGSTNATIMVGTTGNFTVIGYSAQGCSNTTSTSVSVYPTYNTPISQSICEGETYNFFGQNLTTAGTYTYPLYSVHGCDSIITLTLTVREVPVVSISGNTEVCQGTATTLTANGAATYQWSNGTNGANNTVDVFGNYTVTGTSAAGCSSTATTTVIVYSLPVINISGETEICQGSSTMLTANGAETYLWNNGTTDATLTTSNAGTYTVIGTDEHGCYSTESVDVVVYYPTDEDIYVSETGSYEWHDSTYTESGDYTWTGQTIHGCDSVVTLHLTITPTDTTGLIHYDLIDITLYPNPTTGMVTVKLSPETCNLTPEIHLFDIYGRRVQMISVTGETTQIDLSQYATGIYLVKLVNDGKVVATGKVVKQ